MISLQFFGGRGGGGSGGARGGRGSSNGPSISQANKNVQDAFKGVQSALEEPYALKVTRVKEDGTQVSADLYIGDTLVRRSAFHINSISASGTPWIIVGNKRKRTFNSAANALIFG